MCNAIRTVYLLIFSFFFFFNDTATTEIYTLSLHDALPICKCPGRSAAPLACSRASLTRYGEGKAERRDRKSTRLNSSHVAISYAVFCLKKKKKKRRKTRLYNQENVRHRIQEDKKSVVLLLK